jgi:acetoin utilization deacetylase AcuC-like enzyme
MRCSVITGSVFAQHDCPGHPESNERLALALTGIPPAVQKREPVMAEREDLLRVHDPQYVTWLEELALATETIKYIDPDTYVTHQSFDVAMYAAGAAIGAVERSRDGEDCFAMVRPPGHHAEKNRAMGFCLLNNAAIAAAKVLETADRVAIVDWDIHHGNGTQQIFYASSRVLYCSVHQWDAYPYSGRIEETGAGEGIGYTINAPVPARSTGADYSLIFSEIFSPAIARFAPEAVIVSAGQDILYDDPLGRMRIEPQDCGTFTTIIREAAGLPLALVLEGGYGPSHGKAISAIYRGLSGKAEAPDTGNVGRGVRKTVAALKEIHHF